MPFAVTCPGCGKAFRSPNERPAGRGVECPKCGERFHVTADNQQEVSDAERRSPPPLPPDDPPPRRKRRDDDSDPDLDRPEPATGRKRPRRAGRILLVLGLVGLTLCLTTGVGGYLLFFRGGGSAEDKVRPRRDLRMDMFAYAPSPVHSVSYTDYEYRRELSDPGANHPVASLFPPDSGITADQLLALSTGRESLESITEVRLVLFRAPPDVGAMAARCKLQPHPNKKLDRVYTGKHGLDEWILFQPTPTKLLFVKSLQSSPLSPAKLADLVGRDPNTPRLPPKLQEGLMEVSGYPSITGHEDLALTGGISMRQYSGSYAGPDRVSEWYSIQQFNSAGGAKAWFDMPKQIGKGPPPKAEGELEKKRWLRGDRIYLYERKQYKD